MVKSYSYRPEILDVGGRKSNYTIGLPADITITDLPRQTALQKKLHLGINDKIIAQTSNRRSNVSTILLDDMTRSKLSDCSFDIIVAVEVLEHVDADARFVEEVHRVLKPGGVFLMTTPNGNFVKNTNPDHRRHYTREQLNVLLCSHFTGVEVDFAIKGGVFFELSFKNWFPINRLGSLITYWRSLSKTIKQQSKNTHHLIAFAEKQVGE